MPSNFSELSDMPKAGNKLHNDIRALLDEIGQSGGKRRKASKSKSKSKSKTRSKKSKSKSRSRKHKGGMPKGMQDVTEINRYLTSNDKNVKGGVALITMTWKMYKKHDQDKAATLSAYKKMMADGSFTKMYNDTLKQVEQNRKAKKASKA